MRGWRMLQSNAALARHTQSARLFPWLMGSHWHEAALVLVVRDVAPALVRRASLLPAGATAGGSSDSDVAVPTDACIGAPASCQPHDGAAAVNAHTYGVAWAWAAAALDPIAAHASATPADGLREASLLFGEAFATAQAANGEPCLGENDVLRAATVGARADAALAMPLAGWTRLQGSDLLATGWPSIAFALVALGNAVDYAVLVPAGSDPGASRLLSLWASETGSPPQLSVVVSDAVAAVSALGAVPLWNSHVRQPGCGAAVSIMVETPPHGDNHHVVMWIHQANAGSARSSLPEAALSRALVARRSQAVERPVGGRLSFSEMLYGGALATALRDAAEAEALNGGGVRCGAAAGPTAAAAWNVACATTSTRARLSHGGNLHGDQAASNLDARYAVLSLALTHTVTPRWEDVMVFILSLRATGFGGELFMLVDERVPAGLEHHLLLHNVTMLRMRTSWPFALGWGDPHRIPQRLRDAAADMHPVLFARHVLAQMWIADNAAHFSHVMWADAFDVVFQLHPFAAALGGESGGDDVLVVADEGTSCGLSNASISSGPYMRSWMAALAPAVPSAFWENASDPSINNGVVLASTSRWLSIFAAQNAILDGVHAQSLPSIGLNMATLNVVVHSELRQARLQRRDAPRWLRVGHAGRSFVRHVGCALSHDPEEPLRDLMPLDAAGRVLNDDGQVVPVVHMYNRHNELVERLEQWWGVVGKARPTHGVEQASV